jgi:hypothetical protein
VTATDQDVPDLPADRASTPEQRQALRNLLGHRYDMHARTVINQLAQRPALRPSSGESADAVVTDLATVAAFAAADEVFATSRPGGNSAAMACLLSGVRRLPTHLGAVLASWTYDPRFVWRAGEVVAASVMLLAVAPPGRPPVHRPILAVWSAGGRRSSGLVEDGERILFAPGSRFRVIGIEGPDPRQPTVVLLRELTGHETTSPAAAIEERDRRALESLRRVINAEVASVPSA